MARLDCLIIGGGVAGLTAAIYLARYRRKIAVYDGGRSRATLIPRTHNCPGFPGGVAGPDFIGRLLEQARSYGVTPIAREIVHLAQTAQGFTATTADEELSARNVLIATGLSDRQPQLSGHDQAVADGLVRYCPVCDGYEAAGRRIAVLGEGPDAFHKARFLRVYSTSVSLVSDAQQLDAVTSKELHEAGITHHGGARQLTRTGDHIDIALADGKELRVDCIYPALGCSHTGAHLAVNLGVHATADGFLVVDAFQSTNIAGLYAAGDVVSDLHQIAVATGHAAIAATHIHKCLAHNPAQPCHSNMAAASSQGHQIGH
jgi:thioredoxin reductase (NADPH)